MASAVLASRNESNWGQSRAGFMAKTLISNPRSNPNPNPNPASRKHHQIHAQSNGRHVDDSMGVSQSASDDASSLNQKSLKSNDFNGFNRGGYVSFNIASYSRKEVIQLKNRLVEDLEQIRDLKTRIESGEFGHRLGSRKVSGLKRQNEPPCASSGTDLKRLASERSNASLMKMCGQVLGKIMKQKNGWVFNSPVDVVGLGLHDYHQIVKNPMDLGTVKSKLGKGFYEDPIEFAADVRLTFDNAMLYNPKGHDVHLMAEQFLARFEDLFRPVHKKFVEEQREWRVDDDDEKSKKLNSQPVVKKPDGAQASASASNPTSAQSLVPTPSPVQAPPVKPLVAKASNGKQPKPRAKDLNKREMSLEEKQRLGIGLQSLPQEKMAQVVQIIRKRNGHLTDECDEIELDIEAIDTETLWELDRLVTNWKKMMSKIRRQALMGNNAAATDANRVKLPASERPDVTMDGKKSMKGEAGEEDVDIGDEMPMSSFPPVEIEKDDGHASSSSSSSSSSGSDSSSSSDSDSGSSSGSESDTEDAESRGVESKNFSKT